MSAERHYQGAQRSYQEARRNWMIVGGVLVLGALIDVLRDREDRNKKRTRKR